MRTPIVVLAVVVFLGGCGKSEPEGAASPDGASPASPGPGSTDVSASTPSPPPSPDPRLPEAAPTAPRAEPAAPPQMEMYPPDAPLKLDGIAVHDEKINVSISGIPDTASIVSIHGLDAWLGHPRTLRYWSLGPGKFQYEVGPAKDVDSGSVISFSVEYQYAKPIEIHAWDISRMQFSPEVFSKLGLQWQITSLEEAKDTRRLVVQMTASGDITSINFYAEAGGPWGRARANPLSAAVDGGKTKLRCELEIDPENMRTRTVYLRIWCVSQRVHYHNVQLK